VRKGVTAFMGFDQLFSGADGRAIEEGAAFGEWIADQGGEVQERAMEHILTLLFGDLGLLMVSTSSGLFPDVWAMEKAARELRDLAHTAGFAYSVRFLEQVRGRFYQDMVRLQEQYGIPAQN
jgi:hypothetical protein